MVGWNKKFDHDERENKLDLTDLWCINISYQCSIRIHYFAMSKPHSQIHMDREKEINGTRLSMDENNQLHVLFFGFGWSNYLYMPSIYSITLFCQHKCSKHIYTTKKKIYSWYLKQTTTTNLTWGHFYTCTRCKRKREKVHKIFHEIHYS